MATYGRTLPFPASTLNKTFFLLLLVVSSSSSSAHLPPPLSLLLLLLPPLFLLPLVCAERPQQDGHFNTSVKRGLEVYKSVKRGLYYFSINRGRIDRSRIRRR